MNEDEVVRRVEQLLDRVSTKNGILLCCAALHVIRKTRLADQPADQYYRGILEMLRSLEDQDDYPRRHESFPRRRSLDALRWRSEKRGGPTPPLVWPHSKRVS